MPVRGDFLLFDTPFTFWCKRRGASQISGGTAPQAGVWGCPPQFPPPGLPRIWTDPKPRSSHLGNVEVRWESEQI